MADQDFPDNGQEAYKAASAAQKRAADPGHSAWVVANAGSGKTKVLIDRVARLLLKKAEPDSILCVTYTKAAANEMLERLFKTLGAWSIMETGELRKKLGELEGREADGYTEEDLIAARALFARALETPGGLRIETIHAFCGRILRRFPLEANVPPGFSEIEDEDAEQIWTQATREALLSSADITPEVDLISAEAGFGGALKAFRLLRHIKEAARDFSGQFGDDPEAMSREIGSVLNAPAETAESLIDQAMGHDFPGERIRALLPILDAANKTDQQTADALRAVLAAATAHDRWELYKAIFTKSDGGWRASNPYTAKALKTDPAAADLFQMKDGDGREVARVKALSDKLARRAIYQRTCALLIAGLPILNAFALEKRRRAALDFDDLILQARYLLTEAGAAAWVLYKLDGGLSHVLLDEAQDTSPLQWSLLNALTEEFFSGDGVERSQDPRTKFVVGDEKQSIFGFQGADPVHFMTERSGFEHKARSAFGEAVLPDMAMSFRSSPEILAYVDKSFEVGGGPIEDLPVHTARRANQPGLVELHPVAVPSPEEKSSAWDAPMDVLGAENPIVQLAQKVAGDIKALIERGDTVWEEQADRSWTRRPALPGDVLILVQKRGGLFDAIIEALKAENLPVAGADRLVLTEHIGVQDCLNLIRFVLLPEDDLTLAEIMRGPFGGLTDDDTHLFPLAYGRGDTCLWSKLAASTQPEHRRLSGFLSQLRERRFLPPYEFLMSALYELRLDGKTGYERLIGRLGRPARDPLEAFLARALAFDARGRSSQLQGFVAQMDGDSSQIKRDLAAPNGEIRVMTAHGAKGLQAPIVVMPDTTRAGKNETGEIFLLDGVPVWVGSKRGDIEETAALREEKLAQSKAERRRLLYVALTRAQDRLMIYGHWSGKRPDPDKPNSKLKGYATDSWYDTCLNTMESLGVEPAPDNVWRYGALPPKMRAAEHTSTTAPKLPDWLWKPVAAERRGLQLVAPSALSRDESAVLAPFGPGLADRLKRGRLIHALLQRLPDVPRDQRRAAGARFLALDQTVTEEAAKEMLEAAMGVLEHPDIADIFERPGRAEAPIVGRAAALGDGVLLNGRVDRLIVTEQEILVVDFKTDRPAPASVEGVGEAYLAQMGAYQAILREAWPGRRIRAALVWTDGPRLMELPSDLIEKALERSSKTV